MTPAERSSNSFYNGVQTYTPENPGTITAAADRAMLGITTVRRVLAEQGIDLSQGAPDRGRRIQEHIAFVTELGPYIAPFFEANRTRSLRWFAGDSGRGVAQEGIMYGADRRGQVALRAVSLTTRGEVYAATVLRPDSPRRYYQGGYGILLPSQTKKFVESSRADTLDKAETVIKPFSRVKPAEKTASNDDLEAQIAKLGFAVVSVPTHYTNTDITLGKNIYTVFGEDVPQTSNPFIEWFPLEWVSQDEDEVQQQLSARVVIYDPRMIDTITSEKSFSYDRGILRERARREDYRILIDHGIHGFVAVKPKYPPTGWTGSPDDHFEFGV